MKRFLSAFPLPKKRQFVLLFTLLLLLTGLTGFLYLPESVQKDQNNKDWTVDAEDALATAKKKLPSCTDEEARETVLEEIAFYESALKFDLSPWSSYFASEGLTMYAHLLTAYGENDSVKELERILTERDKTGLYEFSKKEPSVAEIDLHLLTSEKPPQDPAQDALLYDIALLESSLGADKDFYFGTEAALSSGERTLIQSLLKQKEEKLATGVYNPIPANRETLTFSEELAACLLSVLLLTLAGCGQKETKSSADLPLLTAFTLLSSVLVALVLGLTTLLFAPGTVEAEPLQWGGTLPFFPALLLRMLCRTLGTLPLILFCFDRGTVHGKKKAMKAIALLPALRYLLQTVASLFLRPLASAFTLGNLCDCIFPPLSVYSLRPASPAAGIFLWLMALLFSFWLWMKKEQKITDEKQEVSLEKQG